MDIYVATLILPAMAAFLLGWLTLNRKRCLLVGLAVVAFSAQWLLFGRSSDVDAMWAIGALYFGSAGMIGVGLGYLAGRIARGTICWVSSRKKG